MTDRFAAARALREIARFLVLKGENPFRARAYQIAAEALEGQNDELGQLVGEGRLVRLPGIGSALASVIEELHRTGTSPLLERLRSEFPKGIHELARVPHLGVAKIAALHAALGIETLEDLKAACEAGRVREVRGFGAKSERRILEGLERRENRDDRIRLVDVLEVAGDLRDHVRGGPGVDRAEIAGSIRRWHEMVGDVDVVVSAKKPDRPVDHFLRFPRIAETLSVGGGHASVRLADGLRVDLYAAEPRRYVATLHRATGSERHVERLWQIVRERGFAEDSFSDEAQVYERLGMDFVPPELREDEGEIEHALERRIPELVTERHVRGMVHCHTDYSDGIDTIEGMARAAEAKGLEYVTITDHSTSATYARGLSVDRFRAQWDEIDRVQEKVGIRILRGTESDILADGSLDYPDAILERLDVVIASIHSRNKMDEDQMTRRIVHAMRQPVFKIWGHALGRLLGRRAPLACRMDEVLDAIASSRAAIEINGDPYRLDLEPRWARAARERGIRFVISTDAHSVAALENLRFGVAMARRAWLSAEDVLNTRSEEDFRRAVRPAA